MPPQICSSEGGMFTVVTFINLLSTLCTMSMVLQTSTASTFMVAFFAAKNPAFMTKFFVPRKICYSSSFVAAEIAWKSYALMDALCVYFQVFLCFCSVFTMLTFMFHTALHWSLWLFRIAFVLNVLSHHSPNPALTILRHALWNKNTMCPIDAHCHIGVILVDCLHHWIVAYSIRIGNATLVVMS